MRTEFTYEGISEEYKKFLRLAHPVVQEYRMQNKTAPETHKLTNNFSLVLEDEDIIATWRLYTIEEHITHQEDLNRMVEDKNLLYTDYDPTKLDWFFDEESAVEAFKKEYSLVKTDLHNKIYAYQVGGYHFAASNEYGLEDLGSDKFKIDNNKCRKFVKERIFELSCLDDWDEYKVLENSHFEFDVDLLNQNGYWQNTIATFEDYGQACDLVDQLRQKEWTKERENNEYTPKEYVVKLGGYSLYY